MKLLDRRHSRWSPSQSWGETHGILWNPLSPPGWPLQRPQKYASVKMLHDIMSWMCRSDTKSRVRSWKLRKQQKQKHQEQQQQPETMWDLGTDVWLDFAHLSLKYGNKQRTLNHRMLWWTKRGNILSIQSLNSEFVDQRVRVHSVQMFYSERFLSTSFWCFCQQLRKNHWWNKARQL